MGAPTSSYATTSIALKVSGALKPHHHDKVETPSVGMMMMMTTTTTATTIIIIIIIIIIECRI
jgi:hypothetical protein